MKIVPHKSISRQPKLTLSSNRTKREGERKKERVMYTRRCVRYYAHKKSHFLMYAVNVEMVTLSNGFFST